MTRPSDTCAQCAARANDCCHLRGDPVFRFGLTRADIARIETATGQSRETWTDEDDVPAWALDVLEHGAPGISRQYPGGHRVALRFDGPARACHWLGPAGCTLDYETRPRTCALYPLWQSGGRLTGAISTPARCALLRREELGSLYQQVTRDHLAFLAEDELRDNMGEYAPRVSGLTPARN